MNSVFWIGLFLGGLLSIPLSIAANIWTDHVRGYLDRRRRIHLSRKKSKEVRKYLYVRALIEGDPSATLLFDLHNSESIRFEILAALGILFSCVGYLASIVEPSLHTHQLAVNIYVFVSFLGGGLAHVIGTILMLDQQQLRRRIRRFSEYESKICEKWGNNAIEEFLASKSDE